MAPASVRARAAAGTLALVDGEVLGDAVGLGEPVPDDVAEGLDVVGLGVDVGSCLSLHPASASAVTQRVTAARPQVLFTVDSPPVRVSRTAASLGKVPETAT